MPPASTRTGELFSDVTLEVGLDFVHFNGMSGRFYTAEVTAAGCGLLDYDNDGYLDLYLVQGEMLPPERDLTEASFPPPPEMLPLGDRLYRNDLPRAGRLAFTDVSAASGELGSGYGMGVAAGDYDNDGWIDLYVTQLGVNQLLRNRGDSTFADVTLETGAGDPRWSVPALFFDYDRDGWLDLFVGNYVDFRFAEPRSCFRVTGARDYCGPLAYPEISDRLLHNRGDGTFEEVTEPAGLFAAFGSALGATAADFDGDGWPDLYVANDGRANQLWINQRDGSFVDQALLRGAALNAEGFAEASMGVVAADLDGDGDEDLFMAHLLGETNTPYLNDGAGMFDDGKLRTGLGPPSKWATGFGTVALDFDNDGWLDVATVNGEVRVIEEQAREKVPFPLRQKNQLFRNLGAGRFEEVSEQVPAFQLLEVSRGLAVGDLDNDGDPDLLVCNNNGPAQVLRNDVGHERHWLGVRLLGAGAPRDMLGTRLVLVRRGRPDLVRRTHADGSFASAHDPRVLFGLGDDPRFERLRVDWPNGRREEWDASALATGRYHDLHEGSGQEVSSP